MRTIGRSFAVERTCTACRGTGLEQIDRRLTVQRTEIHDAFDRDADHESRARWACRANIGCLHRERLQAWLVGELIRYLEHSASGAMAFDDMGPNWVQVRDDARDGSLRKTDDGVRDIALRWDQLLRYAALQLGAQIGSDVQHILSKAQTDQKVRTAHLVDALVSGAPLDGVLRVPNTVGDIEISTDVKARRITACVNVPAPDDRGAKARCSWIVAQLKDAPASLVIESYAKNARTPVSTPLAAAREDRDLLLPDDKKDPVRFRLLLTQEMGQGRKTTGRKPGFIDSILNLLGTFYGSVMQNVTPWTPKAPRISAPPSMAASVDDDHEVREPMDNPPPVADEVRPIPMPPVGGDRWSWNQ